MTIHIIAHIQPLSGIVTTHVSTLHPDEPDARIQIRGNSQDPRFFDAARTQHEEQGTALSERLEEERLQAKAIADFETDGGRILTEFEI